MSGHYASRTDVPVAKSKTEIEATLGRYGATGFGYMSNAEGQVAISFEVRRIRVLMRMQLPMLHMVREELSATMPNGRKRSESAIEREWEQRCRQRWRSLANGVKAKLALIDDGISTVEREFLSDIVVPSTGQTYGEMAIPQITAVYARQALPPLVPAASGAKVIELPERNAK